MEGIAVILLLIVAQVTSGAKMGNCDDDEAHVVPIAADKGRELIGKVWYARYTLEKKIQEGEFKCMKVQIKIENNVRKVYLVENHISFVIRTISELASIDSKAIVPNAKYSLVKSIRTSYGYTKTNRAEFWRNESQLRYPGITYNRSFYLEDGIWAFWECDNLAPKEWKDDHRFIMSEDPNKTIALDNPVYNLIKENPGPGFEGKLAAISSSNVASCIPLQFDYNLI